MQFNLYCDEEWKQTLASTMYMIGMFFGAMSLGNIADKYAHEPEKEMALILLNSIIIIKYIFTV